MLDLLVDGKVIAELKTGRDIDAAWQKQLLNYLRATEVKVGLLFNFGPTFRRYVFENGKKDQRKSALISGKEVKNLAPENEHEPTQSQQPSD